MHACRTDKLAESRLPLLAASLMYHLVPAGIFVGTRIGAYTDDGLFVVSNIF